MNKYLFAYLFIFNLFTASAQNKTLLKTNEVFMPYWYLQLQGGIGYTLGETSMGKLLTPSTALLAGYRFTQVWGLRTGLSGWEGKGSVSSPRESYRFNYLQGNIDVLVDINNLFSSYSANRICSPYLFMGLGLNGTFNNQDAKDFALLGYKLGNLWEDNKFFLAGRMGLGVDLYLTHRVRLNLEVNTNILSDKYNSKRANNLDWQFNGLVGFSLKLGKIKSQKVIESVSVISSHTPMSEAKQQDLPPSVKPVRDSITVRMYIKEEIFFTINSSIINDVEQYKIIELIEFLKQNPLIKVTLSGYADAKTGTRLYNMQLSERRATAVSALLINNGINSERVIVKSFGDKYQPFVENSKNRVVICIAE